ncbi:hypothetical protein ACEPAG_8010 [Sanghuangporus baumii]
MTIATRCLSASYKHRQGVASAFRWQWRRFNSSVVEVPPHLDLPSTPVQENLNASHPGRRIRIKPYYITTPIFYPNSVPHIGHLYSLVIADIFARHARISVPASSRLVNFITGTDEHGLKIQKAAQERRMEPQEFCDRLCQAFSGLAEQAAITHTNFVRTSSEEHRRGVQILWTNLVKSGHVYLGEHSGWYSVSDECFYTESQVCDSVNPKTGAKIKVSTETGNAVEWTKEENYKFALSKFKVPLLEHFRAHPNAIYPPKQRKEIMDILESDDSKILPDLSISRPSWRLKWGIPVPGDSSQIIYVWLDALSSYLTGIGYPWLDTADMTTNGWPVDLQIIGKDILKFHAIYFPAFLMALGLPLPRALLSHAHWTVNKAKMSKSVGNVVDPVAVLKEHGVDAVRWYLARTGGYFKADVDWNDDQVLKSTDELRSLLGNILLRLQSRKVLDRLPPAFRQVPLHRGILLTRGNGPAPLPEPGSQEYDDRMQDRVYGGEASSLQVQIDYAQEYIDQRARAEEGTSVFDLPPMRKSGVLWYSELPEAKSDGEAVIVSSELRESLDRLRGKVSFHLQRFEVGEATQSIADVLSLLNKEITRIQPWSPETQPREIIHLLTWGRETLRICGILLQPFIPHASRALLDALHTHPRTRTYGYACIGAGRVRSGPLEKRVLFPNKTQKEWQQVEADHKYDENRRKRIQMERKQNQLAYKRLRAQLPDLRRNKLYRRLFDPFGSPKAPNCFAPRRLRKRRRTPPTAVSSLDPKSLIPWTEDRKRYLTRRNLLKKERQKKREAL